jgi:hypothetical protein
MNNINIILIISLYVLILTWSPIVSAQSSPAPEAQSVTSVLCRILFNLRFILTAIAGSLGALVIVLQGIKWIGSAEDAGLRKEAKTGIIHAVIGLVIVILSVWIVTIVVTSPSCPVRVIT